MAATTDEEVFNFEGNLEKSFYDFFRDNGIEIATANNSQRLGDDYISVEVSIGGVASDEHMSQKPLGQFEYDHYIYSVSVTIHTDRDENSMPDAAFSRYHRELVSRVRNLLSISRAAQADSLNDKIDLYSINRMVPSGTVYIPGEMAFDETILTFEGDFSILTNAWPSS